MKSLLSICFFSFFILYTIEECDENPLIFHRLPLQSFNIQRRSSYKIAYFKCQNGYTARPRAARHSEQWGIIHCNPGSYWQIPECLLKSTIDENSIPHITTNNYNFNANSFQNIKFIPFGRCFLSVPNDFKGTVINNCRDNANICYFQCHENYHAVPTNHFSANKKIGVALCGDQGKTIPINCTRMYTEFEPPNIRPKVDYGPIIPNIDLFSRCKLLPELKLGRYISSGCNLQASHNTNCLYRCNNNYKPLRTNSECGRNIGYIRCENGRWTIPRCDPVLCEEIPNLNFGAYENPNCCRYAFNNTKCHFKCNIGYTSQPNNIESVNTRDGVITCVEGVWDTPRCNRVEEEDTSINLLNKSNCSKLPTVNNGSLIGLNIQITGGKLFSCPFVCQNEYNAIPRDSIYGNRNRGVIVCDNGKWQIPICQSSAQIDRENIIKAINSNRGQTQNPSRMTISNQIFLPSLNLELMNAENSSTYSTTSVIEGSYIDITSSGVKKYITVDCFVSMCIYIFLWM